MKKLWRNLQRSTSSSTRIVPKHIPRPPYILQPYRNVPQQTIRAKSEDEVDRMRYAGAIAARLRAYAGSLVKCGVTTNDIDEKVHEKMMSFGVYPSPLGFPSGGAAPSLFPKSICTSVDEVVCHGVPNDDVLREGQIVKIDVSVFTRGVHGDCCGTFVVGDSIDEVGRRLIRTTNDCLDEAIIVCEVGQSFSTIGATIASFVDPTGFGIVSEYAGHGIGEELHMFPTVLHRHNTESMTMQVGHTFTIEPMVTEKAPDVEVGADKWSVVTRDGGRAAQFEETVVINSSGGADIITDPNVWRPQWGTPLSIN